MQRITSFKYYEPMIVDSEGNRWIRDFITGYGARQDGTYGYIYCYEMIQD